MEPRAAHFQAVLDRAQAEWRLPSVVAGVLSGGLLTWTGQAGGPGDADTQFRIGSITKTMTAVLVLQCRDEGMLDLDDPVGRFVPETGYAAATLRQLLAHTSGMQSEPVGPWWERTPGTDLGSLLAANDGSGRVFGPDEHHHYSNLGYALLGEVVARLRGQLWIEVLQERLLAPLGMQRTSYDAMGPAASGWSVGHLAGTLTREPAVDTVAMAPAGQLWSTVADLARYAGFLIAGNPAVLSPESLAEMRVAQPPADDYGLGLRMLREGPLLVGHTGSIPGYQASLFVAPDSGDGAVVLTNATTGLDSPRLVRELLGGVTPGIVPAWVPTLDVPAWAAELLGWWFWGNSAFEIRWHNELLELHDLARGERAEQFTRRPDGSIIGVNGYHHGETLVVVRAGEGATTSGSTTPGSESPAQVDHLECATFVYTRTPYPHAP